MRSYVERSSDAEDTLEDQVEFRRRLRDKIRELMEEPDNWELTPERNRAVMLSGLSTNGEEPRTTVERPVLPPRPPKLRPVIDPTDPVLPPGLPPGATPVPETPVRSRPAVVRRKLPSIPVYHRDPDQLVSSEPPPSIPSTGFNSVPPWNRGMAAGGRPRVDVESLDTSLRRRVLEDRKRQQDGHLQQDTHQQYTIHEHTTHSQLQSHLRRNQQTTPPDTQHNTHTYSTISMTETFGDLQESCSDNGEQGETYSVHRSEDEDLLRMEALQQEINALKLKRKHIPSSKSSSSSGSSGVQRVPRPKIQKRASQLSERAVPTQVPDGHLQQVPSHRSPRHAVPVRAVSESRLRSSDDSSCGGGEQRRRRSGYSGRLVKKREKHMASADWSSADEGKLPVRSRGHHGFRRSARRSTSVSTASSSSGDDRRLRRRSTKLKKHVRPLPASSEHLRLKHSSKAAKDDPATVPSEKEATIKGSMVTAKDLKDAWRKEPTRTQHMDAVGGPHQVPGNRGPQHVNDTG